MTPEQQTYLINRLNEVEREKIAAKSQELFGDNPHHPKAPTWGEVFAAIKAGELVLKEGTEDSTRPYMMPTDCEWPAFAERIAEHEANKVKMQDYKDMLTRERKLIVDGIMLGDAADGIKRFAAL
jgi:hypothetical protein